MVICCGECCKTLRFFLWYIQFQLIMCWKRFFRCKPLDAALDEISEQLDHKHNITRHGPKSRPDTYHELKGQKGRIKPVKVHYPENVDSLVRTVRTVRRFRPIGSGQSWREVVETGDQGELISLASMNRILHVDHANLQVTFQAGILVRDAIRGLAKSYGLAFVNIASCDRSTLGGAIVGGSHGTSGASRVDTFTSSIVELKMITAQGGDITLDPGESVTYGVGGIIYQVTLKVIPFYYIRQIATQVDPGILDFEQWWDFDYGSFMARWYNPNDPSCSSCQLVQFEKANKEEYEDDRNEALRYRSSRVFMMGALPFLPKWKLRRSMALLQQDTNIVDTYYRIFVDGPALHHLEWEYAVPMSNNPNHIVEHIPQAVSHIPYPCEVQMRLSPKDCAIGHLAHEQDVVWFNLSVTVPKNKLRPGDLEFLAEPFERLVTESGPDPVMAHPHKLVVNANRAGLTKDICDFLASFQYTHDPKGKMFNDALADLLRGRKPKQMA